MDWNQNLADWKNSAGKAVHKVSSAIKTGEKIGMEITGVNDVVRFAKNPSLKGAAMLGVDALMYLNPELIVARGAAEALKAGTAASEVERASRTVYEAKQMAKPLIRTMNFANKEGVINAGANAIRVSADSASTAISATRRAGGLAAGTARAIEGAYQAAAKPVIKAAAINATKAGVIASLIGSAKTGAAINNKNKKK